MSERLNALLGQLLIETKCVFKVNESTRHPGEFRIVKHSTTGIQAISPWFSSNSQLVEWGWAYYEGLRDCRRKCTARKGK